MFKLPDVVFRIRTTPGEVRFAKAVLIGMAIITASILLALAILP
jgi:hypothetical protein